MRRSLITCSLFDLDPDLMLAAVRQRGDEFPDTFAETGLGAQVEVPFAGGRIRQPELVAGRSGIRGCRVDSRIRAG